MADCYEALGITGKRSNAIRRIEAVSGLHFWKEIGQLYAYLGEYDRAEEACTAMTKMDDYYSRMGDLWFYQETIKRPCIFIRKGLRTGADKKAEQQSDLARLIWINCKLFEGGGLAETCDCQNDGSRRFIRL